MGIADWYMQMKYENMYIFIANHSTKVLLLKTLLKELFFFIWNCLFSLRAKLFYHFILKNNKKKDIFEL